MKIIVEELADLLGQIVSWDRGRLVIHLDAGTWRNVFAQLCHALSG